MAVAAIAVVLPYIGPLASAFAFVPLPAPLLLLLLLIVLCYIVSTEIGKVLFFRPRR
jgi:Mg2+-importing ATPase